MNTNGDEGALEEQMSQVLKRMGSVVESTGRMMQRNPAFTNQDLADLRDCLLTAANTVEIVRTNRP